MLAPPCFRPWFCNPAGLCWCFFVSPSWLSPVELPNSGVPLLESLSGSCLLAAMVRISLRPTLSPAPSITSSKLSRVGRADINRALSCVRRKLTRNVPCFLATSHYIHHQERRRPWMPRKKNPKTRPQARITKRVWTTLHSIASL